MKPYKTLSICSLLFISILLSCDGLSVDSPEVTYSVTGNVGKALIVYRENPDDLTFLDSVSIPWEISFQANSGDYVYLSADSRETEEYMTASINIDGKRLTASKRMGLVQVSGRIE